ncbi:HET-domain-containing protein [Microthyrium microscopicum]|uniref:HET-domain-containing protein n=1 Tax=Microthyrium microscopicum TaxID=703497 RepID=A0A6A6UKR6_9PEZI|nr:HET-domain-containing protein [Microthyrium microscopicum]
MAMIGYASHSSASSRSSRSSGTSIHIPLDPDTRQIRLLSFRQQSGAVLACGLRVFDLDDPELPDFIALSYTWGSPYAQHEIRINGAPMEIRENLRSALDSIKMRIIRSKRILEENGIDQSMTSTLPLDKAPDRWKYFWIDAICINQDYIPERNKQVAMMRDIYTCANFCLVWLGTECESSLQYIETTDPVRLAMEAEEWTNPPWQMENLIYASYWSRMWIVQEFVLAHTLVIAAGRRYLHWESIQELFPPSANPGSMYHYNRNYSMTLVVQERYERDQRREQGFFRSLATLLVRFTDSECSDQRDKIFALLGLFSESSDVPQGLLQADYELNEEEIYLEVMQQADPYLTRDEWYTLRVYVSSALEVDPDECDRMARRSRRGSNASRNIPRRRRH